MMEPTVRNRPAEILLVEDNPADAELTALALQEGGFFHELHVVGTGEDAMTFLRQAGRFNIAPRPDLILLDLHLPGKSGLDVLQETKEDDDLRRIPVVILTISTDESHIRRAYELCADLYVTKTARLSEFVNQVLAIKKFWAGRGAFPSISGTLPAQGEILT